MLIISVRDHENNRWKRNAKKTNKDRKKQGGGGEKRGGIEAIVKGWELNYFVEHLS